MSEEIHDSSIFFCPCPGCFDPWLLAANIFGSSLLAIEPLYFKIYFAFLLILNLKVLCQWLMDQAPIGNKAPRPGFARQIWCPACRGLLDEPLALTSGHVLLDCMVVEGIFIGNLKPNGSSFFTICPGTRIREGIRGFLVECARAGRSQESAHRLYVNGMDAKGLKIPVDAHKQRGASLSRLTDMWLSTWG